MLGARKGFVGSIKFSFHSETEHEIFKIDVITHQPHLDALFGHQAEAVYKLIFTQQGNATLHKQLGQVVQSVTHTADDIERTVILLFGQLVGISVSAEFAWFYFLSHRFIV